MGKTTSNEGDARVEIIVAPAPTALSPARRAQIDKAVVAIDRQTERAFRALVEVADLLATLFEHDEQALAGRGVAFEYLASRVDSRIWGRRRLYEAIEWGRLRAEVRALPGPAEAFMELGYETAHLLAVLPPSERERWARDIQQMHLGPLEVERRLEADGIVEPKKRSHGDSLTRAWSHLRARSQQVDTWDKPRCLLALKGLDAILKAANTQKERVERRLAAAPTRRARKPKGSAKSPGKDV